MARCKVIYLSIVSGLLLILFMISASADTNGANETNQISPTMIIIPNSWKVK